MICIDAFTMLLYVIPESQSCKHDSFWTIYVFNDGSMILNTSILNNEYTYTHLTCIYVYYTHYSIYWKRRNTNTDHHFTILSMCILNRNVMMWNPHHNTDQPESNPPITELWSLFLCLFLYLFLWNLCPFLFCHLHWWSFTGVDRYFL